MDGPWDYPSKWSKSDRETSMISLICGILKEKWHKWTYLQNRNRLTDTENKLMVTKGKTWGGGINQELGINIHTLLYMIENQQGPTI